VRDDEEARALQVAASAGLSGDTEKKDKK